MRRRSERERRRRSREGEREGRRKRRNRGLRKDWSGGDRRNTIGWRIGGRDEWRRGSVVR